MAKLTQLPEQAIIDGFKGKIDFYVYMGIPCARKWPCSPGHNRSPQVQAQWPAFAFAGSYWNSLSLECKQAWNDMVIGSPLTGRDLFTKAFISATAIKPS